MHYTNVTPKASPDAYTKKTSRTRKTKTPTKLKKRHPLSLKNEKKKILFEQTIAGKSLIFFYNMEPFNNKFDGMTTTVDIPMVNQTKI